MSRLNNPSASGAPVGAPFIVTGADPTLTAEVLFSDMIGKGLLASRPVAGVAGRLYYVTDGTVQRWTRDSGSAWEDAPPHWNQLLGVPATFTPAAHVHPAGDITSGRFGMARMPDGALGLYLRAVGAGLDPVYSAILALDLPIHVHVRADITDFAHKDSHKSGGADAFSAADLLEALVKRIRESGGADLAVGAIADGEFLKRSGASIISGPAGGSATMYSASIPFTDGDTLRRVTIANGVVTSTSKISGEIVRPNTIDADDRGFIYEKTVVRRATGEFDLLVVVKAGGFDDPIEEPVNETVEYHYTVG